MSNSNRGKVHFVGLCGVGMAATAALLRDQGFEVTGSDYGCHPPISDYLRDQGIAVNRGYRASNLPEDLEFVVGGGSAKLDPTQNEELRAAHARGLTVTTFAEVLGGLSKSRHAVAVVGSYGKSTCATLLSWVLTYAGRDPSYFIGAIPRDLQHPGHLGADKIFVLEGDEYPTSGIDRTSKFLYFDVNDVVFTSGEHDHVNIFRTLEEYLAPYRRLFSKMPKDGLLVACVDNPHVAKLVGAHHGRVVSYGLEAGAGPLWTASEISYGRRTNFNLIRGGEFVAKMETAALGTHNVQNIVGAAAILIEREFVTGDEFASGIAAFTGIARRLDLKTERSTVQIYEGFGSSLSKARSAIDAVRLHFPDRRLIVVFEPHAFSWRSRRKLDWYDSLFTGCDGMYVFPPPSIGASSHGQVASGQLSHDEIIERIRARGFAAVPVRSGEEALSRLEEDLSAEDVVLLLTSGDLDGLISTLPGMVESKFPYSA